MEWVLTVVESPFLYGYLWLGIIAAGDIVMLPALYFSIAGLFPFGGLLLTILAASFAADALWYMLGRILPRGTLFKLPLIQHRTEAVRGFSRMIDVHGVRIAFIVKFIIGTRAAAQILCGMHRLRFIPFIAASIAGTAVWVALFSFVIYFVDTSIAGLESIAFKTQIALTAAVVFAVGLRFAASRFMRTLWFSGENGRF